MIAEMFKANLLNRAHHATTSALYHLGLTKSQMRYKIAPI